MDGDPQREHRHAPPAITSTSLRPPTRSLVREPGMLLTVVGTLVLVLVWVLFHPPGLSTANWVGEMLGMLAIWQMSTALLAISDNRRASGRYGGITGQLWWHRLAGTVGLVLAVVHPQVVAVAQKRDSLSLGLVNILETVAVGLVVWAFLAPGSRAARWRGPLGKLARSRYDVWRTVHAVLGVFLVVAIWHAKEDAVAGTWTPVMFATWLVVAVVGVVAFVERLVVRRVREHHQNGTVVAVRHLGSDAVVLHIEQDHDDGFVPGNFVYLGTPSSQERPHPFTVADVHEGGILVLGIKAGGAGTEKLVQNIGVGERVYLSPPQGELDSFVQPTSTVWVAGGAGITPMIASIRTFPPAGPPGRVTLVWSYQGGEVGPVVEELQAATERYPNLSVDLVDTTTAPRITAATVLAASGVAPRETWVRLCGPNAMVSAVREGLLAAGVPEDNIHLDSFSFR